MHIPRSVSVPLKRFSTYYRLRKDTIAGVTVGIIAIPLGLAFAIASGVKPEYGIYTTIIAAILVAIFGGSRYQVTGPTGAFIPVLLSIVLTHGYEDLLIAGFLAGIMLVLMGIFKLGSLIKYIPRPVTIGFTAGIAINIFATQIPAFLGLTGLERHESFLANMHEIVLHIGSMNAYSILTALLCLVIILVTPRRFPKIPGALIGIIISGATAYLLFPGQVSTIGSAFGGIPTNLPTPHVPEITVEKIAELLRPAFAIATLGAIESLLSAVVADGMTGQRHNSNKELIGQGIANIVVPLFGGIPATGAIARTATNIKSGAVSPLSIIISAVFVLFTMLFLAPLAAHIPLASMAAILMVVSYNMSEHKHFHEILKTHSNDAKILIATFLFTVFSNLTTAIEVGLLLSVVMFTKRMSDIMVVNKVLPDETDHFEAITTQEALGIHDCRQVSIFNIEGPLFFGAAQTFSQTVMDIIDYTPKVLILRMSKVPFMDLTGENRLRSIIEQFMKRGGIIFISGLNSQPEKILRSTGLYDQIGADRIFRHTSEAISQAFLYVDLKACTKCDSWVFKECPHMNQQQENTKFQSAKSEETA